MTRLSIDITEEEVARLAVEIAAEQEDGVATFDCLRKEIPRRYRLSAGDLRRSITRPNEPMWEQRIRNIQSHHDTQGNFIYEGYLEHVPRTGYRVTELGQRLLGRQAA